MQSERQREFDFFTTSFDANQQGYFGEFGGRYVPEMLWSVLEEIRVEYRKAIKDEGFKKEFLHLLKNFVGRPSALVCAENLAKQMGGAKIFLKNEGGNLTGAHKINHCIGQALIAKRMGRKYLIAETGAGQHGVATATVAAKMGMKCKVFMGSVDIERQKPNVNIMKMLGAEVIAVNDGQKTLKDAVTAAIKYWLSNSQEAYYVLGSCLGPDPYPSMNEDFQSIIGFEIAQQLKDLEIENPDYVVACVGGGSNAMGAFSYFLDNKKVNLVGVEAGGEGIKKQNKHASRFGGKLKDKLPSGSKIGIFHGYKSYFLQDKEGNISETHSISAGLDYPGIGPQLTHLFLDNRVKFANATDKEALSAMYLLAKSEGIIPAMESAHAVAYGISLAKTLDKEKVVVINLSGRGDKDLHRFVNNLNK